MRIGAAALAGGVFGALGTLCFFLAFGTDYWLVASDNCGPYSSGPNQTSIVINGTNGTEVQSLERSLLLHHEGFFWHCLFHLEPTTHAYLATLLINQPEIKLCVHGYLFPLPVVLGHVPHAKYDTTAVFRGFWTVLIILGLASALIGGFLLVCGVPFISSRLYKLGGVFIITAACLFLFMLLLYVLWMEVVDVKRYILQERGDFCVNPHVSVFYGFSFMVAAAGVSLELVSGLVFVALGRALGANVNEEEYYDWQSRKRPSREITTFNLHSYTHQLRIDM